MTQMTAHFDPQERRPWVRRSIGMLIVLVLAAVVLRLERMTGHVQPLGGVGYDWVQMVPQSGNPIAGGTAGVWAKSTTGRVQMTDTSGNVLEAGEARKLYSSAGAPASPSAGDIWWDSSAEVIGYRDSGGSRSFPAATAIVTTNTSQSISGSKTVAADWTTSDNAYDLGDSTHRWQQLGVLALLSGTSTLSLTANVADGAAAVAHVDDNTGALTNATSRIRSFRNAGVEKAAVRYDGALLAPSAGTSFSAQHAFPTGTGDLVSLDATQTLTGKTLTSPTINGATFSADTLVYEKVVGGVAGALGAATDYMTAAGISATTTEYFLTMVTHSATAKRLYCRLGTAPGGADTAAFTVRKNGSDQALTCTISAAGTTCNDTSNTFSVVAADRLSIKAASSAGTAASATCAFDLVN